MAAERQTLNAALDKVVQGVLAHVAAKDLNQNSFKEALAIWKGEFLELLDTAQTNYTDRQTFNAIKKAIDDLYEYETSFFVGCLPRHLCTAWQPYADQL